VWGISENKLYYQIETVLTYTTNTLGKCWVYYWGIQAEGDTNLLPVVQGPPPPSSGTQTGVPQSPTGITYTYSGEIMLLRWDPSQTANNYQLNLNLCQQPPTGSSCGADPNSECVAVPTMTDLSQTVTGTTANFTHLQTCGQNPSGEIRACNASGCSTWVEIFDREN